MCLMGIEGQESAAGKHIDYRVEERLRGGTGFEDLTERNIWPSAESDLRRAPTSARPAAHFDAARGSEVGRVEGYRLAAEVLVRYMVRHRGKDRKSTRLNSSHANISYAVFCLKKKN